MDLQVKEKKKRRNKERNEFINNLANASGMHFSQGIFYILLTFFLT